MSIRDQINRCLGDGGLFLLPPALTAVPVVRTLLVAEEVRSFVLGPWDDKNDEIRGNQLRQFLDQFSEGKRITISASPYKKPNTTYMSPVDPVEDRIFEIRNRDKPAVRTLGAFAERDVFVPLVWEYRINLGGPDSKEWRDIRERCKAEWRKRFYPYNPLPADDRNDLATNIILV